MEWVRIERCVIVVENEDDFDMEDWLVCLK